jgi:dethiobiotin synthetase
MTKGIFITATGTDVGKTFVSALLVKKMKDLGLNCGYYKPVLSGAEWLYGELVPGDCAHVKHVANLDGHPKDYLSYMFEHALSPHLAAKIENTQIKLDKIQKDFENIKTKYDYIVVEGSGGIVCPMDLDGDKPFLIKDIIKGLKLDTIIVAPAELGSINSAVLTVEYAKNNGINVKGIILNKFNPDNIMQQDNKKQIEKLTGIPIIAEVKNGDKELFTDEKLLAERFKEI